MTKKEQEEQIEKVYALFLDGDYDEIFKYQEVLNKRIASLFLDCDIDDAIILAFNLAKFKNLDFDIASRLVNLKNWEIDEIVLENFDKFKLTISQKKELENLIHEEIRTLNSMKDIGIDEQTIFNGYINYGEVHIIVRNLNFFKKTLDNKWNAKKLINIIDNFKLIKKINSKFKPPLDDIINLTDEIFREYATNECYKVLTRVNNNDKFIINELKLQSGGRQGLDEVKLKLLKFKDNIIKVNNRLRINLDSDEKKCLYGIFFKNLKEREEKRNGHDIDAVLFYINLSKINS